MSWVCQKQPRKCGDRGVETHVEPHAKDRGSSLLSSYHTIPAPRRAHPETFKQERSYIPPGVLYDWFPVPRDDMGALDPARMLSPRPTYRDEERLAAAHVNHLSTDPKDHVV